MPIENEFKYVLRGNPVDVYNRLLPFVNNKCCIINQAYLGGGIDSSTRIRHSLFKTVGSKNEEGLSEYNFTWKHTLKNRELMEIDPLISKEDFQRLLPECTRSVKKIRLRLPRRTGVFSVEKWDVDFFLENDLIVFAMAEAELPEKAFPHSAHELIQGIDYMVKKEDTSKYSSWALSVPENMKWAIETPLWKT